MTNLHKVLSFVVPFLCFSNTILSQLNVHNVRYSDGAGMVVTFNADSTFSLSLNRGFHVGLSKGQWYSVSDTIFAVPNEALIEPDYLAAILDTASAHRKIEIYFTNYTPSDWHKIEVKVLLNNQIYDYGSGTIPANFSGSVAIIFDVMRLDDIIPRQRFFISPTYTLTHNKRLYLKTNLTENHSERFPNKIFCFVYEANRIRELPSGKIFDLIDY